MFRQNWKWIALSIFAIIGVIMLFHHEIWRDEWQAWLIARDSNSLAELYENVKYEGHPTLWHLLLYGLTKITHDPWIMQLLHLIISMAAAALILFKAPFAAWQKIGLVFGYFFLFEYTVLSRSYGLSLLLVLLFCWLYSKGKRYYLWSVVMLFLLGQTHFYGLVISVGLAFWMLLPMLRKIPTSRFYIGQAILLCGWALAVLQIIPPDDTGHLLENRLNFDSGVVADCLGTVWKSFVPIPSPNHGMWNTNIADLLPVAYYFQGALGLLLLLVASVFLSKKKAALGFFWSVTIIFMVFSYIKFYGFTRHHGMIFVAFIGALWLSRVYDKDDVPKLFKWRYRLFNPTMAFILSAQLIGAGVMCWQDFTKPFSKGKEAAQLLLDKKYDYTVYVERDYIGAPIAGYLGSKVIYLRNNREGSFVIWNKDRLKGIAFEKAARYMRTKNKDQRAALLLDSPLENPTEYGLKELFALKGAIEKRERYYCYVIDGGIKKPNVR